MEQFRRIRLSAMRLDGSPTSLREAVLGVYRGGLDPEEHTLVVVDLIEEFSTPLSGADPISAPPSSNASTETGAAHDKGVQT